MKGTIDKTIKSCWVGLSDVLINAPVGVHDFEREQGNQFIVDFEVKLKYVHSVRTDELDHTIDYSMLFEAIQKGFAEPAFLLEFVAGRILTEVRAYLPDHQYKLCIRKLTPAIPNAQIGQSVVRLKGKF
jgi:dihydroneopterin aldolase